MIQQFTELEKKRSRKKNSSPVKNELHATEQWYTAVFVPKKPSQCYIHM